MKTKLPTPQLLPSGMYRCQVMVNGKRESVVDEDPDKAQAKAVALKNGIVQQQKRTDKLTVGQAIDRYIESKDAVLSPSTISEYKRMRKNKLQGLMDVSLRELTQERVQREINSMAKTQSPKTVRNAHGLLSAALREYLPDLSLHTTLPQKRRYEPQIPSEHDISIIMSAVVGTDIELPVTLAVWLGLRMSEILGLTWDCVNGNNLQVKQAKVTAGTDTVLKGTKTFSGTRTLRLPPHLLRLIQAQPKRSEFIVTLDRHGIYKRFTRHCQKAGLPHYRFHDLRHANASVMLALNIPDKYAMERMGHATNNMLKTVYQHTMTEKKDSVANLVDDYFEKLIEQTAKEKEPAE